MHRRAFLLSAAAGAVSGSRAAELDNMQVFLLIGQSNMVGRGSIEAQDREPMPDVFSQDKNLHWQPAVDPLHWDNANAGVGPGRSFARVLRKANPHLTIGLVPAAVGGTGLDEWQPGGKLYNEAVRRVTPALQSGTLRGILWHQGERDSRDNFTEADARTYIPRFGFMIDTLRRELGAPATPVVVGQIGEYLYERPQHDYPHAFAINEMLSQIPVNVYRTGFASSAGLGHIGDVLHFNAASQRELGRRYGHAFLALDAAWEG